MKAAARPTPAFPWDDVMAFGLGTLRLSPRAFWAMTPRELAAAAGLLQRSGAPARPVLEAMMRLFPDRKAE